VTRVDISHVLGKRAFLARAGAVLQIETLGGGKWGSRVLIDQKQ